MAVNRLAVCTAWGSPFSWTHAAYNMMNLKRPEGVEVMFYPGWGWCPARRHMYGVELALEWGATHICFLGGDQVHELDILVKFWKHIQEKWKVVTALVPARGRLDKEHKPFQVSAWKKTGTGFKELDPEDGPYQAITIIGSGALVFEASLLNKLRKPWFKERVIDDHGNREPTMDTRFVHRLHTEAKADILCDCTIKAKHLDVFGIDPSYGDRFPDWPVASKENKKEILGMMFQPGSE